MARRILIAIPVIALFAVTSLIFMSARAPRTWSDHWRAPNYIAAAAGQNDYAAVPGYRSGWDVVWIDNSRNRLVFTPSGSGPPRVLDQGDIQEPTIIRLGDAVVTVWVHNRNGSSDLQAAVVRNGSIREVRLLHGPQTLEHPYLFAGRNGSAALVVSWQRYGNFDTFLIRFGLDSNGPSLIRRLTHAALYSFFPRAAVDGSGAIGLLHYEVCCRQERLDVMFDRFDWQGRKIGPGYRLYQLPVASANSALPSHLAADLEPAANGDLIGIFAGSGGVMIFRLARTGRLLKPARFIFSNGNETGFASLALVRGGGFVFWEQPFDIGVYVASRRFDAALRPLGAIERLEYEAATETGPQPAVVNNRVQVMWQASRPQQASVFEATTYQTRVRPSLAERLGLGLGNPWAQLFILLVTSALIALLATVGNILIVFGFTGAGLLLMRPLRRLRVRWMLYSVALTIGLNAVFVRPSGLVLFLPSMSEQGVAAPPFGIVATLGAGAFILWMGFVAMKKVEDLYRAGVMAILGVYFFVFIEAVVFIEQRLGYI